eukprot:2698294-Prymnesium_polylepis.1
MDATHAERSLLVYLVHVQGGRCARTASTFGADFRVCQRGSCSASCESRVWQCRSGVRITLAARHASVCSHRCPTYGPFPVTYSHPDGWPTGCTWIKPCSSGGRRSTGHVCYSSSRSHQ